MKLAIRILRTAMPRQKAEALAGDLIEDLGGRWRSPILRIIFLLLLAAGYAAVALALSARTVVAWIDVKLAFRMLVKYPGLTVIAVFSMAVAIACGAGTFAIYSLLFPSLPLHEGDRIVSIENYDTRDRRRNLQALHDFVVWRGELTTLTDVGAFVTTRRNLITASGAVDQVPVAQMSAAGFGVGRVAPLMGRALEGRDEGPGADPVVVIGEAVWRRMFGSDPAIVGQTARLGSTSHTIVGVMPEEFAFPVNHSLWVPFDLNSNAYERGTGPRLNVFARLAPGIEQEAADSELEALGVRLAEQFPETNRHLRPRIVPYASVFVPVDEIDPPLYVLQAAFGLLLVVIAVNVAILVYARTVTRAGEIAVRAALGASRRRIISQLFIEAAALSTVAGLCALLMLQVAFVQLESALATVVPGGMPFWIELGISPHIVLTVAVLSLFATAIAGMAPAVKVTGRTVQTGLQHLVSRGAGLRLGKGWTTLVVGQTAVAAALLPGAVVMAYSTLKFADADPGFPAGNYLVADMGLDLEPPAMDAEGETVRPAAAAGRARYVAHFAARQADLRRELAADPGVTAVTSLWAMPGREPNMWITLQDGDASEQIRFGRVDPDYFPAFGGSVIAGRAFTAADNAAGATAVIVNQHFVNRVLRGGPALGQRIRYVPNHGPGKPAMAQDGTLLPGAYEIVGIVSNIPARELSATATNARVYHPTAPEGIYASLAIGVRPERASAVMARVRDLAVAIDPSFRLNRIRPLIDVYQSEKTEERWGAVLLSAITLAVLVLAGGGISSLMSVTVSRRRREIGIRAALGGEPRRIFAAVLGRALALLGAGVLLGVVPAILLLPAADMVSGPVSGWEIATLHLGVVLFLVGAGAAAAYGPARRGLRIQPTEALRAE
jgi:predicted permease